MTATFTATQPWLLPGIAPETVKDWYTVPDIALDGAPLRFPRLEPRDIHRIMDRMLAARQTYLVSATTRELIELVHAARDRWLNYNDPFRAEADRILPTLTAYAPAMVQRGLDDYLSIFKRDTLKALIRSELGDLDILDGFRERRLVPGKSRAYGPEITTHVFSGNVPGLAAQSLVMALLLKSASFGKLASGEPLFATLFARSLIALEPRLADCFAVTWWPGGEALETQAAAFSRSDAVIAYGSEAAVSTIQRQVPGAARFLGYGHRLSFGLIGREALTSSRQAQRLAARAAYDVAKFDQQGCVSPHLFYVEEGGETTPREWAALLAGELERLRGNMPRGTLTAAESASVAAFQRNAEFRSSLDPDRVTLFTASVPREGATVVFDADPVFAPTCLNRTVAVKPIAGAGEVIALLQPVRAFLQTAALALTPERCDALADALGAAGVTRICPVGKMPDPDPAWHHDGRFNLLDLVRFTDREEGYPL